jgi:hypothetical protein
MRRRCTAPYPGRRVAAELSNHLNILERIRLALEVPKRARDRGASSYHFELAPAFESAMSFDCEFEQVVHRNIVCTEKRVLGVDLAPKTIVDVASDTFVILWSF